MGNQNSGKKDYSEELYELLLMRELYTRGLISNADYIAFLQGLREKVKAK